MGHLILKFQAQSRTVSWSSRMNSLDTCILCRGSVFRVHHHSFDHRTSGAVLASWLHDPGGYTEPCAQGGSVCLV